MVYNLFICGNGGVLRIMLMFDFKMFIFVRVFNISCFGDKEVFGVVVGRGFWVVVDGYMN